MFSCIKAMQDVLRVQIAAVTIRAANASGWLRRRRLRRRGDGVGSPGGHGLSA